MQRATVNFARALTDRHVAQLGVVPQPDGLLHWTLFIVFKADNPSVQRKLMDWFLCDKSLQIISISATHLLRCAARL